MYFGPDRIFFPTGIHIYPVSQSHLDGKMGAQPGQMRVGRPGPQGIVGWTPYGTEDGLGLNAHSREPVSETQC